MPGEVCQACGQGGAPQVGAARLLVIVVRVPGGGWLCLGRPAGPAVRAEPHGWGLPGGSFWRPGGPVFLVPWQEEPFLQWSAGRASASPPRPAAGRPRAGAMVAAGERL